ncbi:MAG: response regulator, partial [Chloroflexia bacterium]
LVILDVMLPGIDGYEVCARMQADPALSQVPVIMLTARSMTDDLVVAYETGANDYVTKPCDIDELLIRIRAQLHHLYHEQVSDLTGLPGSEAVEDELRRRSSGADEWAVCYIDVTNLRVYNEAYSFSEGDALIRVASRAIRAAVAEFSPDDSFIGHLGGANFVAVAPPDVAAQIQAYAQERFTDDVQQYLLITDRERGYMIALDHDGRAKRWTLPSLGFDKATVGAQRAGV